MDTRTESEGTPVPFSVSCPRSGEIVTAVQKVVLGAVAGCLLGVSLRERRTEVHMQTIPSTAQMKTRQTVSGTVTATTSVVVELEEDIAPVDTYTCTLHEADC